MVQEVVGSNPISHPNLSNELESGAETAREPSGAGAHGDPKPRRSRAAIGPRRRAGVATCDGDLAEDDVFMGGPKLWGIRRSTCPVPGPRADQAFVGPG